MLTTPKSSFDFLLGRLQQNECRLFSDASSLFGMGGVLIFGKSEDRLPNLDGLFWQLAWQEWHKVVAIPCLKPGNVKINKAEFIAALITCETFAAYSSGKFTTLALDNHTAKAWFDSTRCPIFPFDRCAQGVHLFMLEQSMKIKTTWIPSAVNLLADTFSRSNFSMYHPSIHNIAGTHLRKVRPRWLNVTKFV